MTYSLFQLNDLDQLSRYVYFGGIQSKNLRPLIWLYLLGHYPPGCDAAERRRVDQESKRKYEEIRAVDEEIKEVFVTEINFFITYVIFDLPFYLFHELALIKHNKQKDTKKNRKKEKAKTEKTKS